MLQHNPPLTNHPAGCLLMTHTPRKLNICMVTSVRNEGVHLLEWIAYHHLLGIGHFLIFSNDCDDGTDELLNKFQQAGMVTHVPQEILPAEKPQEKAFLRAWQEFLPALKPDYVFVADPDEFLNLKCFASVEELLDYYGQPDALAIQWRHFGSSGLVLRDERLTVERFIHASLTDNFHNRQFKTISRYDPAHVKGLAAHRPLFKKPGAARRYLLPGICREGVRVPQAVLTGANPKFMPGNFPLMHAIAQVNHYAVRSVEEFNAKRNRGNGILSNRMKASLHYQDDYFIGHDLNDVEETSIHRFLPQLRMACAELIDRLQATETLTRMESLFTCQRQETT